jgi:hypothetical protein
MQPALMLTQPHPLTSFPTPTPPSATLSPTLHKRFLMPKRVIRYSTSRFRTALGMLHIRVRLVLCSHMLTCSAVSPDSLRERAAKEVNVTTGKPGIHPLYAWSNSLRPLPREGFAKDEEQQSKRGGYLPVLDVCEAVLKTGWRGPWSYEVSRRLPHLRHLVHRYGADAAIGVF